ncbi:MAG: hypothetical protein ACYCY9_10820 [Thiobacillus sp.]
MTTTRTEPLLTPGDVAREYGIPASTQRIWKYYNRYGWRDLTIKLGSKVRYERKDLETWLASRKGATK